MNKTTAAASVAWATIWVVATWPDAQRGAWPGLVAVAMVPAIVWLAAQRRRSAGLRAAEAEALAWSQDISR